MKLKVVIHKAEEGGYWGEVPALKGCVTQGETFEEILINIQEAIKGWLESQNEVQVENITDQIVEVVI